MSSQLRGRPGPRGLRNVADDRHGARERAAGQHAQLHRGEPLDLVHHDVAEGADFVVGTARDRAGGHRRLRQALGPEPHLVRRGVVDPLDSVPAGPAGSGAGRAACAPRRSGRCPRPSTARRRATRCAGGTRRASSSGVRIPLPAAARSGRAPRRSCRNSWGESRGHMRSSASDTSGTRRSRWARSFCSSWLGPSSPVSMPLRESRAR